MSRAAFTRARRFGCAFHRRGQGEVGRRHLRDIDEEIDAIEEGAGDAREIIRLARRSLAALESARPAAALARIGRRHELEARGIAHMPVGARHDSFAILERLPKLNPEPAR